MVIILDLHGCFFGAKPGAVYDDLRRNCVSPPTAALDRLFYVNTSVFTLVIRAFWESMGGNKPNTVLRVLV